MTDESKPSDDATAAAVAELRAKAGALKPKPHTKDAKAAEVKPPPPPPYVVAPGVHITSKRGTLVTGEEIRHEWLSAPTEHEQLSRLADLVESGAVIANPPEPVT